MLAASLLLLIWPRQTEVHERERETNQIFLKCWEEEERNFLEDDLNQTLSPTLITKVSFWKKI